MPSPQSPNMGLFLPIPGATPGPQWAAELTANQSAVDTHDHTSGKGVAIPIAAVTVNADFSWLTFGLTNIGYAAFVDKLLTANLTVNSSIGNVSGQPYWRDSAGVVKKITLAGDPLTISGGSTVGGSLLFQAIPAPASPAAGFGAVYVDSTSKALAVKNDAGTVSHTAQTKAVVANQFLTGVNDAGLFTGAQPDFTNLSGSIAIGQIGNSLVTNAKLANMATLTIKGNNTGGATAPIDLTVAQVNAILPVFTSVLNGLAPLSGGGTTNFLRADGTWASPGGGGGITQLTGDVTAGPGSGSQAATLANVPSGTLHAGSSLFVAIVAPGTPAAGRGSVYVDSTSKALAVKTDAGVVSHTVQTRTASANNWIRSIADDGSTTISQPAFTDISGTLAGGQFGPLTGNVTTSGYAATLAQIPTAVPAAGSILFTAIAAPATPSAGVGSVYVDSTSKNISVKDDAGVVKHGVRTQTASANNWIRAIADDGSVTISQPAFTDISGANTTAQLGTNTATNAVLAQMAANTVKMNNTGSTANAQDVAAGPAFDGLHTAIGTIASAATTDLATTTSESVTVTGAVTITALGTMASGVYRRLIFSGAPILTHNASSLILRKALDLQVSAGDVFEFVSLGSGNWRQVGKQSDMIDVQVFTVSGTYRAPANLRRLELCSVAPGGGGGSGRRGAAASVRGGGGGGGGGGLWLFGGGKAFLGFSTTASIQVGAIGVGGVAQTTNSTNGNSGTGGTGNLWAGSNIGDKGGAGGGGSTTGGTSGAAGTGGTFGQGVGMSGGAGGVGGVGAGAGAGGGATGTAGTVGYGNTGGGGGGGGITAGNATEAGGSGGSGCVGNLPGGSGAANAAGTNGGSSGAVDWSPTGGGGGGGSSGTVKTGGNGGSYGGGGGGGGASLDGTNSGAGGDGGPGAVLVISFLGA